MHGIQATKRHILNTHLDMRGWYARKRKQRADAQIRDILGLPRPTDASDMSPSRAMLPPVWAHKTEARTGDIVYLGRNNSIWSFVLSALSDATPDEGIVSSTSPISEVLLGKHQGDIVRLRTLDGNVDYTVLKII